MMANWKEIKEEYVAGGVTYRALAEKHGVAYGKLAARAKKEEWCRLRRGSENGHTETIFDGAFASSEDLTAIAEKLMARVSELVEVMALDTHGIKQLTSALKDLRDIQEHSSELALRRAKLRKLEREVEQVEAQGAPNEITVLFDAGLEAWNE